jgi:hypothetical protein
VGKIKGYMKWTLWNGLVAVSLWFGLIEGIRGAWMAAQFCLWFNILMCLISMVGLLLCSDTKSHCLEALANKKEWPFVDPAIDFSFDFLVCLFLAWHSHLIVATCFLFGACHTFVLSTHVLLHRIKHQKMVEQKMVERFIRHI